MKTTALSSFLVALSVIVGMQTVSHSQVQSTTTQASNGATEKLTISLTSTHGVSTSAQMSPGFSVETRAAMNIDSGSFTNQNFGQGASGSFSGTAGGTQGVSSENVVKFAPGTVYEVMIKPRSLSEGQIPSILDTASGSASGSVNTTLTIESTQSAFTNSFIQQFQR